MDLVNTKRIDRIVKLIDDRMVLQRGHTTFYPDEEYRSIILSNEGEKEVLVYGEIFSGKEFENEFKIIR